MKEHVVLVDEQNRPVGLADKYKVHSSSTPLHRGFSLFIFNTKGELLLQKRASSKKTWPNVWSNSVCGHPSDGESAKQAAIRRAQYELGLDLGKSEIRMILEDYRYRYEHHKIVENEICPVMVAFGDFVINPNPDEVAGTKWVVWSEFLKEISKPNNYSEWCQEEAQLLNHSKLFLDLYISNKAR